MKNWNKSNGAVFRRNQYNHSIQHRTGGAHPGTEQRPVCRRLMLSMVSSVLSSLNLSQATDGKDSKDE